MRRRQSVLAAVGVMGVRARRVAVPSTWPWTTWPPRGEPAGVGSSRLTMASGRRRERVVRAMVSAARSAEKRGGKALGSMLRAVRQTPLTAMLSPVLRREVSVGEAMVILVAPAEGVTARRVPVVSMRPVNIVLPYRIRGEAGGCMG